MRQAMAAPPTRPRLRSIRRKADRQDHPILRRCALGDLARSAARTFWRNVLTPHFVLLDADNESAGIPVSLIVTDNEKSPCQTIANKDSCGRAFCKSLRARGSGQTRIICDIGDGEFCDLLHYDAHCERFFGRC